MRQLEGIWKRVEVVFAMGLAVFHLWTGIFGLLPDQQQRAVHVCLALFLVFLLHPLRRGSGSQSRVPWWDIALMVSVLLSMGNMIFNWKHYLPFMVSPATFWEIILAVVAIIVVLEAGRRTIGWIFPILTAISVTYALWGQHIPGEFGHAVISWRLILTQIYFSYNGIWGFLTGLSATYIALFVIFGAILLKGGGGQTFIDMAMLLAGRFRGGPAKVAVLASGFFAMLSGSPMANVSTTGNFTIPMMKKLGYKPEFAAGVEAVASTGGIVTPPIMGAVAFIMADLLGIPYLKVIIAAAIPAFLFYVTVFMGVHFQAVKLNLRPIPKEDLPHLKNVLTWGKMLNLFLPIIVLLYTLLAGYSLTLVATSASLMALLTYILSGVSLQGMKERVWNIPNIVEAAGKAVIGVVPVLVCANIVLRLLNYTGLTLTFSSLIISIGEDNLILSVVMTAVLVMILGTGLPVSAAYILGVVTATPLLAALGILPLAAHLFVMYYAILATITPPVCPTAYLGAHIAQADWMKTALVAIRLAPLLYIMPFLLVFDNTFLMIGAPLAILLNVGTAGIGAIVLASGTMGQFIRKCKLYESLVLVAAGLLLLIPGWQTDLLGVLLLSTIMVRQLVQRRGKTQSQFKGGNTNDKL